MDKKKNVNIKLFKTVAILEGVSFLLLLGVAMPLKYVWGYQEATKIIGMVHGLLFIVYVYMVFMYREGLGWNAKTTALALIASVLPFAPFVVDRKLIK